MKTVESKDNPLFKKLIACRSPHLSKRNRLIKVEGLRHVADLFASGVMPDDIFISNDVRGNNVLKQLLDSVNENVTGFLQERVVMLPDYLFVRASELKTPQGIMALVKLPVVSLAGLLNSCNSESKTIRLLFLEDVQDPGNVGTLIRTADAFAFDGVILSQTTASLCNPKTISASMGSLFHLPVIETDSTVEDDIVLLKNHDFTIIGSALQGGRPVQELPPESRIVLILGNEGKGLSEAALASVDDLIRIPMPGNAESLNVAAAGAVMMWELVKQIPDVL